MKYKRLNSTTLKDLFITEIESNILSGELHIHDKLPNERELALEMGISRSVVHEGLVELERRGFIHIEPRQGAYVADYKVEGNIETLIAIMKNRNFGDEYIHSVLDLRNILIEYAMETAIPNLDKEGIETLKNIVKQYRDVTSLKEAGELIFEFDHIFTSYCDNILLPLIFTSFKIPNTLLFERYCERYGIQKMHDRNLLLLERIERKDIEGAKEIMRKSIQETIMGKTQLYKK